MKQYKKKKIVMSQEKFIKMYQTEGMTYKKMAAKIGVHSQTVGNWVRSLGISKRKQGVKLGITGIPDKRRKGAKQCLKR